MATTGIPIVEFLVQGTPISRGASSPSRTYWQAKVRAAARAALPAEQTLVAEEVRIIVIYFYVGSSGDLDNILKPILDALKGTLYVDDNQVVNIVAAKRSLTGSYVLTDLSPIIIEHLERAFDKDFVYIAVELSVGGTVL